MGSRFGQPGVYGRSSILDPRSSILGNEGEFFGVGEVSQASDLTFVFDEVGFRDEWNREPEELGLDAVAPDLIEGHVADRGEDVDMILLGSEAEIFFILEEIGGGETFEGNSEGEQGVEGGVGILFGWTDEDVEVVCGAHVAVSIYRDSTDHGVFNLGGVKRGEE